MRPEPSFYLGPGRYINGGERLLLWRTESHVSLNNENDHVRLLNAAGDEVDRISWEKSPKHGLSISRLPDGQAWQVGNKGHTREKECRRERRQRQWDAGHSPCRAASHTRHPNARTRLWSGWRTARLADTVQAGGSGRLGGFRAVVVAPPGLYNASIYVADAAPTTDGPYAGIGINIFLRKGEFPTLQEGDQILVRGVLKSFRGEMELQLNGPDQIWRINAGAPLQPLAVTVPEIGEALEGRLVTFTGVVSGWQGDSIFTHDPAYPEAEPVRVTVRSSLGWKRPYVKQGQSFRVIGVVSQLAAHAPWNGGYRVMVRFREDLRKLK